MKRARLEKTFIEELQRVGIVSLACQKSGLSRQSVYRWMKWDTKFREKFDEALKDGIENVSDLAESKLINNISNGNMRGIEFWLTSHRLAYHKPKKALDVSDPHYKGITTIENTIVDENGKPISTAKQDEK